MTKRTDTTSIPKQAAAQELLESATALLAEKKDVATVKEDAANLPFSPLSFFKPTPLSVASVIAFLLNPKASHGQSMLFLNAFSEDLSRHLEATGLARSVKVPPLTDNTSIYLTETTKPQDVAPRAFNNGLVIVRCTPANTTDASGAVDSSPSLDIKLQRGKAVLIADFGDSDCPWRTNGEGAVIVRY
mgnify:FL=1